MTCVRVCAPASGIFVRSGDGPGYRPRTRIGTSLTESSSRVSSRPADRASRSGSTPVVLLDEDACLMSVESELRPEARRAGTGESVRASSESRQKGRRFRRTSPRCAAEAARSMLQALSQRASVAHLLSRVHWPLTGSPVPAGSSRCRHHPAGLGAGASISWRRRRRVFRAARPVCSIARSQGSCPQCPHRTFARVRL